MERLEDEIAEYLAELDSKRERLGVLSEIIDRIMEISSFRVKSTELDDIEEYYIEQINRWMVFSEEKIKEAEIKEDISREREKRYLMSLKKIKELEKENEDAKTKCAYYKAQIKLKASEQHK